MKMIDLSYPIYQGMFKFWGDYHPEVEVEQTGTYERDQCMVHKLTLGTHSGTHIDAPRHFFPDGQTIDRVPLSMLVTEAVVFNLTDKGPNSRITLQEVDCSRLAEGEAALFNTGWSCQWGKGFYENFPVLEVEVAEKLMERGAASLAVDFPLGTDVHQAVLGSGKLLIENLTSLDQISADRVQLIALPLKFLEGDGAPARVIAVEE